MTILNQGIVNKHWTNIIVTCSIFAQKISSFFYSYRITRCTNINQILQSFINSWVLMLNIFLEILIQIQKTIGLTEIKKTSVIINKDGCEKSEKSRMSLTMTWSVCPAPTRCTNYSVMERGITRGIWGTSRPWGEREESSLTPLSSKHLPSYVGVTSKADVCMHA